MVMGRRCGDCGLLGGRTGRLGDLNNKKKK